MVTVTYRNRSEKKQIKTERIQLIATGITLVVILLDPLQNPALFSLAVRVIAVVLGVVLIVSGAKYARIRNVLGGRLETILTRLSGIVMILSGIILKIAGSETVYLVQIFLGLLYIFILPALIRKGKGIFRLSADETGVKFHRIFRRHYSMLWDELESVSIRERVVTLHEKGRSKPHVFHVEAGDDAIPELYAVFEEHTTIT